MRSGHGFSSLVARSVLLFLLLLVCPGGGPTHVSAQRKIPWSLIRNANWTQMLSQPSVFVSRADDAAVAAACAPGSPTLVTTPTLFVLRDRHSNYAHEMEVVITDQAPPTGFLETWARISRPHRLRVLAQDPFPPGTCFASAFHVYTFAAGIGYNTNADTVRCESPVVAGLSGWLRQINLETVRLLLNASAGWKSMRMVRNEDAVVAGLVAAVQQWNAQSCLLRRFDRAVKARPSYMIGSSIVDLEKLWALDEESGESCRRTNVLFKFVDGDFNELTYHQQLQVWVWGAMDFVAGAVMEAQERRSGPLRLVLDDQTHFNVVSPPLETCPAAAQGNTGR
eukprot:XP_001696089.1 predicted protein [Chlamydomonas reinhardtii]